MLKSIRTFVQDEYTLGSDQKVRGAREWSAAELLSPTWFFVESHVESTNRIRRWITTSISEATRIQNELKPSKWARIYICTRTPNSMHETNIFEEIDQAYAIGGFGQQVFGLSNGLSYALGLVDPRDTSIEAKEVRLLYNRKSVW